MKSTKVSGLFLYVVSLLLVGFGQPSWVSWLAPIAAVGGYGLLWMSLKDMPSNKTRFWAALLWFTFVQTIQLSWMTSIEYQGIYILFVYIGLSLALGFEFAIFTHLLLKNTLLTMPRILAFSGFWTLIEWSRYHILCGFSWNPAGMALASFPVSMQLASIGGVLALSFWVIATNLLAFRSKMENFAKKPVMLWCGAAVIPYILGSGILFHHQTQMEKHGTLRALLVQPGLLPSQKIPLDGHIADFMSPWDQWTSIFRALKEHHGNPIDLIVLPESAVPFCVKQTVYDYSTARSLITREFGKDALKAFPDLVKPYTDAGKVSNAFFSQFLANYFRTNFIIGVDDQEGKQFFSSALQFTPWQDKHDHYAKRVLVPLAEYLPFQWCLEFTKAYGIESFYTHGTEAKVFSGPLPLSVSICYEETFPDLIREGRLKGALVFVNITNDNWYPNSNLAEQHFDHGKLRAVENGVPVLRACNSGVTAAVDALGRTMGRLDAKSGTLLAEVPNYQVTTIYTYIGDALIVGLSLGFILFYLVFKRAITRKIKFFKKR